METVVRTCAPRDIAAVAELERQWEAEGNYHGPFGPMGEAGLEAARAADPQLFLVAERGGEVVGFAHGSARADSAVAPLPAGGAYMMVENIYVRRDSRGHAVGGLLLDRLLETARAAGLRRFAVSSSSVETERIVRFYRRHGFTPWSVHFFL